MSNKNTGNYRFTKQYKLLCTREYKKVFVNGNRIHKEYFTAIVNSEACDHSRLGIVISKKSIKYAVNRNRVKRIIRENFRIIKEKLNNVDVIILLKKNAGCINENSLRNGLDQLWQKLMK